MSAPQWYTEMKEFPDEATVIPHPRRGTVFGLLTLPLGCRRSH